MHLLRVPTTYSLFAAALFVAVSLHDHVEAGLRIYWCDVEGGAATLIVSPEGESILVDAGLPGERDPSRIVKVATEHAKVEAIDHMVVTHFDTDHFGGVADLSKLIPIHRVYDPGLPEDSSSDLLQNYLKATEGKRTVLKPGDRLPLAGGGDSALEVLCIAAQQQFLSASAPANDEICETHKPKEADLTQNANSTVLLFTVGSFRFLDAADLTWELEKKLVCPVNLIGSVDVFQVNHHGLDSSNNPVLVTSVQPTVAVMNNGVSKGCATETVATLRSISSIQAVYQLHRNLPVGGNTPPDYIANLVADCQADHVELEVSPDTTSFTVRVPSRGHSQIYSVKGR